MKLIAPPAVQARHLTLKRQGYFKAARGAGEAAKATPSGMEVAKIGEAASAGSPGHLVSYQQHLIQSGPPVRTPVMDTSIVIPWTTVRSAVTGDPQPERLEKADGGFVTSLTPPFVNRILAPYQKYAKQLGVAEMVALDALYEMGAQALSGAHARLTSAYDPNITDAPGHRDFSHMGEKQRQSFNRFFRLWDQIDEGLKRVAYDLVFEMTRPGKDRPVTLVEAGRDISNYQDERRAIGGAVGVLRSLAWRVIQIRRNERRGRVPQG
jgi:hypothetical protein